MVFKTDDFILSIDNNFKIKKVIEKNKFLIKILDIKTKDEYILCYCNDLKELESDFNKINIEISKFSLQTGRQAYLEIKKEENN